MTTNPPSATSDGLAAQTPLVELLRAIPVDYRACWTDEDGLRASHYAPVGKYCHQAADRLAALQPAARGDVEALARINSAMACPYDGGIWEGKHFNRDPFVTVRLADMRAILAALSPPSAPGDVGALVKEAQRYQDHILTPDSYFGASELMGKLAAALSASAAEVEAAEKRAFTFAFAAGFKCADETSRSCISAMDDAWGDYRAALTSPDGGRNG